MRSRISIARVSQPMNGVEPQPDDQEAVDRADVTAPVNSTTGIAEVVHHASPTPEPPISTFLMISHAPSIGARSNHRFQRKVEFSSPGRIKVSAITTTESSEDCCRMLE